MKILVTGGTSGLGAECKELLLKSGNIVLTMAKENADIVCDFSRYNPGQTLQGYKFDAVLHCAGVNMIKPHNEVTADDFYNVMDVNAWSQFEINRRLITQGCRICCHVISDAAFTPMTHSLIYNVSKAAQLMIMRQMAHEEKRAIIFGISPGKIDGTGMSEYINSTFPSYRGMTYEEGRKYQLSRLRTGEMPVGRIAKFVCDLLDMANEPIAQHMHGHNYLIGG